MRNIEPIQIERRAKPTVEEIERDFMRIDRPVVISGWLDEWPALTRWNEAFLRDRVGGAIVQVSKKEDAYFDGDERGFAFESLTMRFNDYLDIVHGSSERPERYYMQQEEIRSSFPPLVDDFSPPAPIQREKRVIANLWVSSAGSVSPLHYDLVQNFLAQVTGAKRLILYPPSDTSKLYPFPALSASGHLSRINAERPDLEAFPHAAGAQPYLAEIRPGDVLFIPGLWWHHVRTLERSISVNFWWSLAARHKLRGQFGRMVLGRFARRFRAGAAART